MFLQDRLGVEVLAHDPALHQQNLSSTRILDV
jgi:hypothetical protein